jgi:hypothetical protein
MGSGRTVPTAAMPDLSSVLSLPVLSLAVVAGRYAVIAYATFATILTTACLTLHAITTLDRRVASRSFATTREPRQRRAPRPLFVRLEPVPDGD